MAHIKHKPEEKLSKAKRICDVYAMGENDLESCCDSEGIVESTFRAWRNEVAEIAELYKYARERNNIAQKGTIRQYALNSLAKAVKGYEYEEVTTEAKNVKTIEVRRNEKGENEEVVVWKPQITKKLTKTVKVLPNPTLVMFALNNSNVIEDPTFNHASKVTHTGGMNEDGTYKPIAVEQKNLSIEQLLSVINGINK